MDRIWFGDDRLARAARLALAPAERLFAGVSGLRSLLYDAGWATSRAVGIPVISIGNLTVGGTGKTPISAWIAGWLRMHGARPAIVMRGYGEDEPEVHRALNPEVDVVVGADRASAVGEAMQRGADIAVLDDGFQHRQLKRDVDIVLVSADRWTDDVKLLPAGPWREPLSATRRADLVIVTRKAATSAEVDRVHEALARIAPRVPRVSVALEADGLRRVGGEEHRPITALAGQRVVAVSAIGDPLAFVRQLEAHGAVVTPATFRDHHAFSAADILAVTRAAASATMVVCTLKDAVKLRDRWPREAPPLWYVSQRVVVERGVGGIERLLEATLRARDAKNSPANSGPV